MTTVCKKKVLKDLILISKDGEWGKGESFADAVEMVVVRGTDFEKVREGNVSDLPIRHIPRRIAVRKTLQTNDIIFETAGGSKDRPTGRTVLLKRGTFARCLLPMSCASFSRFIRIDPDQAEPGFVFWLLQHLYDSGHLRKYHTQHTGVARFQFTMFAENEQLQLPDKPVQKHIAAILSAYDDLVENNTRRIVILEETVRSLYREWFVNFRFPGHENVEMVESPIGPVPHGWTLATVGEVAQVLRGRSYKGADVVDEGGMPFLNLKCVDRDGGFRHKGIKFYVGPYKDAQTARSRDIVMAVTDMTQERRIVARAARVPANGFAIWVMSMDLVRIAPFEAQDRDYLYGMLRYSGFADEVKKHANGVTILHLSPERIEQYAFVLPPEPLRRQYAGLASDVYSMCDALQSKNAVLRRTRDLLLPRLISGQLDVSDIDATATSA